MKNNFEQRLRRLESRVGSGKEDSPQFQITYWKRDPITGKPIQVDPNEDDDDKNND